jgi:hypothetical protein
MEIVKGHKWGSYEDIDFHVNELTHLEGFGRGTRPQA